MRAPREVTRARALAFRLAAQHLDRRLPAGAIVEAAATCGIPDTPPGAAALSLHARVAGLTPDILWRALVEERTLLRVANLRGAPHVVPTRDAAVFTRGLLPEDEASLRAFIRGAVPALDRLGLTASDLLEWTSTAVRVVLDGRSLSLDPLGVALAERMEGGLTAEQAVAWQAVSEYGPPGEGRAALLGEALAHFGLYLVALRGEVCFAPRTATRTEYVRTDQWLGRPIASGEDRPARLELVRRYLRAYGPSAPTDFAAWAGIGPAQARRTWAALTEELVAVRLDGRAAWLHVDDVDGLDAVAPAEGVRLLPPHDPLLQARDRATLLPDRSLQQRIWRPIGRPGVVLAEGQLVGAWRARKRDDRLSVTVEHFDRLAERQRAAIEAECASLAPFKECSKVDVAFAA